MQVHKFGGASVKDADGVKNLAKIVKQQQKEDKKLIVVVSAMGKTTNALEKLLSLKIQRLDWLSSFEEVVIFHQQICETLFVNNHLVFKSLNTHFNNLKEWLEIEQTLKYDYYYDQVVSYGEMISTTIIAAYLNSQNINSQWVDARKLIATDNSYRSANVDFDKTTKAINETVEKINKLVLTQGFIGSDKQGHTTTLGREGSDYTAALIAYTLNIKEVSIWKDVDGIYNADPKIFNNIKLIDKLSYKEAVELAFYGASIIHPKTIQPLKEKNIELKVRSFYSPKKPGSTVNEYQSDYSKQSTIIVKKDQLLLSLTPLDFSFMDAANMGLVFEILSKHHHQINLIQNSAISFSLCIDENPKHFEELKKNLQEHFILRYNTKQVLLTLRHYQSKQVDQIYAKAKFNLEQRSRSNYQVLVNEKEFNEIIIPILEK